MEIIQIGKHLYLDPLARCIIWDNQKRIFLTQLEFLILCHFSLNINKVLYIEDIVNFINDSTKKCYTEQNVYVYIRRIRIKLEKNYKDPKILLNIHPGYILYF